MPLLQVDDTDDLRLQWRVGVPRERVWECLTEATLLQSWLGEPVEGAVAPGAELVVDHGGGYLCRSAVVEHVAPHRLLLTWLFPDEPPSSVLVTLEELGPGTADSSQAGEPEGPSARATGLQLTHHGLGDLVRSYRDGWCVHLTYLEAAALGAPLPASMFWNLHSTIARLAGR